MSFGSPKVAYFDPHRCLDGHPLRRGQATLSTNFIGLVLLLSWLCRALTFPIISSNPHCQSNVSYPHMLKLYEVVTLWECWRIFVCPILSLSLFLWPYSHHPFLLRHGRNRPELRTSWFWGRSPSMHGPKIHVSLEDPSIFNHNFPHPPIVMALTLWLWLTVRHGIDGP